MTTWIHEACHGQLTGQMWGRHSEDAAKEFIDIRRRSRDTDPVWSAFKDGYDWHLVDFGPDSAPSITFTY